MLDLRIKVVLLAAAALTCFSMLGCRSKPIDKRPSILFEGSPPLGQGGAGATGTLRGRVIGAHAGLRVVLYVLGGKTWWIQPLTIHPFTAINADGTWSSPTHLGSQYGALLVTPGYTPSNTTGTLPAVGGEIIAVAIATPSSASAVASERHVRFSNYDWMVRQIGSDRNGSPHDYDPANVRVDANGFLHLSISNSADGWRCSEVALPRSLGYGSYAFTVEDLSKLEPAAVLSMFTWDDAGTDQDRREVDFEVSRWGELNNKNAQYIVQPFYRPANNYRYAAPPGELTYIFHWEPKQITFRTFRGKGSPSMEKPLAEHSFSTDVPEPRTESVHLNFCTFEYARVPQQNPSEAVIAHFQYLP